MVAQDSPGVGEAQLPEEGGAEVPAGQLHRPVDYGLLLLAQASPNLFPQLPSHRTCESPESDATGGSCRYRGFGVCR